MVEKQMDKKGIGKGIPNKYAVGNKYSIKHGYAGTPTYESWKSMRRRCNAVPGYADKGIKWHPRWDSFENFLEDMGTRPSDFTALGRIDHNKDYGPDNCRWEVWRHRL